MISTVLKKMKNGAKMDAKMDPKSMQNRALGAPGLSFCGFGRILEDVDFSCFFWPAKSLSTIIKIWHVGAQSASACYFWVGFAAGGWPTER